MGNVVRFVFSACTLLAVADALAWTTSFGGAAASQAGTHPTKATATTAVRRLQGQSSATQGVTQSAWGRLLHATAEEGGADDEEEVSPDFAYVMGIMGTAATFIIGHMIEHAEITWIPEAAVGLMIGFFIAAFATEGWIGPLAFPWAHYMRFDFEFFMTMLLPPIIFEAGFNMKTRPFFANLGPTMFYAFIGTFASTFIVGGLVYTAGQMGLCYPLGGLAALVFGSLISATDPVTVLAVFQALGVKDDLFSMVFGESVLNDAVAIVLSRTLLSFNAPDARVDAESVASACLSFVIIFVGSTLIGGIFGLLCSILYKYLGLRLHEELLFLEACLSFVFPWMAYYTTEALELSGIVAILMAGITMAQFMKESLSDRASVLVSALYKVIAQLAETYVFVYLGMAFVAFPIFKDLNWPLVAVAIGACFVGRLHIFVGSALFNSVRTPASTPKPISGIYMFIMWFSGLRGGVAFALASVSYGNGDFSRRCGGLPAAEAASRGDACALDDSTAILQTTIMIAALTIFVFGGAITDLARASGILKDFSKEGIRAAKKEEYFSKKQDLWSQIDAQLTPYLTAGKASERVKDKEWVRKILTAQDGILAGDEEKTEWYFRQENEWALSRLLQKITMVQGQFRGVLHRKKASKLLMA